MRVFVVGGTFDSTGGRPSKLVAAIALRVKQRGHKVALHNGGNVSDLPELQAHAAASEVVLWFPNVPNRHNNTLGVFKHNSPCVLLVTSKRNDDGKYSFAELVNHALKLKANLTVEYVKVGNIFRATVFDPLGCVWARTENLENMTNRLFDRIEDLLEFTREGSHCLGPAQPPPDDEEVGKLYGHIRNKAMVFHDLIHPADGVERFLGNVSFRCERGFPSFKKDGAVYVSRRNVDKRYIGPEAFVRVLLTKEGVGYYGEHKPSVDTPVQLRLYDLFPKVRFMLHSHVYIEGAPFTKKPVPCGALEEVQEIAMAFINKHNSVMMLSETSFSVNLLGHGSLIMSDEVGYYMRHARYYARTTPESMWAVG